MTINTKQITEQHVRDWLFTSGLGPDEALEHLDEMAQDILDRKSSPTARMRILEHLRRIYKRATGLRLPELS